jgi:two-component system, NarL family, response regulator
MIATEKTNQEIAEILSITPGTVRVHVHAILHKLGVADRKQAVITATQNNLLDTSAIACE